MTSALLYHSLCNSVDVFCHCYFAVTKSISNSSRLNCFFCPSIASTLFVREVGANLQLGLNVMSRQKSCASTSSATPPVRATVTFVPWVRHPPHLSGIGSQCAAPTGCFCNCSPQKTIKWHGSWRPVQSKKNTNNSLLSIFWKLQDDPKNVSLKIRSWRHFDIGPFFSLFLVRKPLSKVVSIIEKWPFSHSCFRHFRCPQRKSMITFQYKYTLN